MLARSRNLMTVALTAGVLAAATAAPPALASPDDPAAEAPTAETRTAKAPTAASGPREIVLVHGMNDSSSAWNSMVAKLKSRGYTDAQIHRFDYPTDQGSRVEGTARDLGRFIDKKLRSKEFDIVSHSLGSLISRYWMATANGSHRGSDVVNWVSLSGPNHGNQAAGWWGDTGIYRNFIWDVKPGSPAVRTANNGDAYNWLGETGENSQTQFTTLRSACDEDWFNVPLHVPVQVDKTSLDSTSLGGAINYKVTNSDNTFGGVCPSHAGMPSEPAVQNKVIDTLTEEGGSHVWDQRSQSAGTHSAVVQGRFGKARVHYTVRAR
ncbi:esterase/lipase family protein [Streptomyces typhae]|nr:alpha/beta fold hydrolase [Streptomyces typhae]